MLRLWSLTPNLVTLNVTSASHQVHSPAMITALRVRVMSCDIELQGIRSRRQAGMALKRAEVWPNSRPPAARYQQAALLGDDHVARKHVTSHSPDAVQARPAVHLLTRTTLRTIQKMLRLSSANVAEGALVVRLEMESTHA